MNRKAREQAKMAAMKEQELRQFKKAEKNAALMRCDEIDKIKSACEHRLSSLMEDHNRYVLSLKEVISSQAKQIELLETAARDRRLVAESLRAQVSRLIGTNEALSRDLTDVRLRLASYRAYASYEEPKPPEEIKHYDGIRKIVLDD